MPALAWTSAGFTKPLRLVLEAVLRPRREVIVRSRAGVVQEVTYRGEVPHLFDTHLYEPATRAASRAARRARRLQSGSLRAYLLYLLALVVVVLALARVGSVGMSAATAGAGVVQLGGVALAPLAARARAEREGQAAGSSRTVATAALPRAAAAVAAQPRRTRAAVGRLRPRSARRGARPHC